MAVAMDTPATISNEWYTPAYIIETARNVLGGIIELDPASCADANRVVKATRYFTEQEDGLAQRWNARTVWLNPPYSSAKSPQGMKGGKRQGPTSLFISKLIASYACGDVGEAVVCVNADMVRPWFQLLWPYALCFASRPVMFTRPTLKSEHHFFPTCFAYLGPNESRFMTEFSHIGTIAKRVVCPIMPPALWEGMY